MVEEPRDAEKILEQIEDAFAEFEDAAEDCLRVIGEIIGLYHHNKMKERIEAKDYWLFFFKDPEKESIFCTGCGHNAIGDYRASPYFIGMKKITINLEELEK